MLSSLFAIFVLTVVSVTASPCKPSAAPTQIDTNAAQGNTNVTAVPYIQCSRYANAATVEARKFPLNREIFHHIVFPSYTLTSGNLAVRMQWSLHLLWKMFRPLHKCVLAIFQICQLWTTGWSTRAIHLAAQKCRLVNEKTDFLGNPNTTDPNPVVDQVKCTVSYGSNTAQASRKDQSASYFTLIFSSVSSQWRFWLFSNSFTS